MLQLVQAAFEGCLVLSPPECVVEFLKEVCKGSLCGGLCGDWIADGAEPALGHAVQQIARQNQL